MEQKFETQAPVSGGTLLVTADKKRAVAADPDSDLVWTARLDTGEREHVLELEEGDEPGRLVEDAEGLVHVVLRGPGEVATIDPAKGALLRRVAVCAMPRGIAYDAATDRLHVACSEGKLVTLSVAKGTVERVVEVGVDLRDVLVKDGRVLVTKLRTAELLALDGYGEVVGSARPPGAIVTDSSNDEPIVHTFTPTVAWRAVSLPDGGVLMVHQRAQDDPVRTTKPGGYGADPCVGIVHGAVAEISVDAAGDVHAGTQAFTRLGASLPVDVAVSADGQSIAVAAAGSREIVRLDRSDLGAPAEETCTGGESVEGAPVGVAFVDETLVVLTRNPVAIEVPSRELRVELGVGSPDLGNRVFHSAPNGAVACASCHPEGREDGHVWSFDPIGPRRSQSLRGGVSATLPLHWDGDMENVHEIMEEVFVHRMGGTTPTSDEDNAIREWIDALPDLPALRDPEGDAAQRGKVLFARTDVGCALCHTGERLTNNRNEDVGKGQKLQVPSLRGVAWRMPLMHDGCAKTLADRFQPACGGTDHGDVSGLSQAQLEDLIAYLESL